jgi:hypothetical protein
MEISYSSNRFTNFDISYSDRLASFTLLSKHFLRFWLLWEVHTDDCQCSYCTGEPASLRRDGWRGRRFGIFLPESWRHGWKVLTFRTGDVQHYLRLA